MSTWASAVAWAATTAAMMLPSVSPVAFRYGRSLGSAARAGALLVGYLAVWTAFALAASAVDRTGLSIGSALALALAGLYQLSPLKQRCLARCRSPFGFLLRFAGYRGRLRDARAGAVHGAYCLGCCWALMATLLAVGSMNVTWMVGLAALILLERTWRLGNALATAAGVALVVLAVAVAV